MCIFSGLFDYLEVYMKIKEWINILVIALLLGFSYYRFHNRTFSAQRTLLLLDTHIEIFAMSRTNNVDALVEQAFQMIEEYELKFSYHNPRSVLYRVNQLSGDRGICKDIYEILRLAELIYYQSNHLYDVSIGALYDIWDFDNEVVPSSEDIEMALRYVGFDRIEFDENSLYMPSGFKLNFGSLAKGFIIDKVMDFLIVNNVREAYINAGGDIRFFSNGKRKWRIGVRHPRDVFTHIAVLNIPDMAVATSGDYERYFILDGVRYHHILNPKTGFPASPTVSVTVLSPSAFLADALSTAALVMNPFDAIEMIRLFDDTEVVIFFYDEDGEPVSLQSEGIRKWLRD